MENVGLQALSKLEDTIMKIIDLILKLLDQRKLKDQISDLKKENKDLRKQLEGKGDKEGGKGDTTISQKIKSNEKKIEGLENALATREQVQAMLDDPDKKEIKAMAQEALGKVGTDKNLQAALKETIEGKVGKSLDQQTMGQLINAAQTKASEMIKGGDGKSKTQTKTNSTPEVGG